MGLLTPTIHLTQLAHLEAGRLAGLRICGLILDLDNTLALTDDPQPLPGIDAWLAKMKQAGISLIICSNNSKKRVAPFADAAGLLFVSRACKPLPFGFWRALKKLHLPRKTVAVAGDQLFTDILGAKLCGMKSILAEPSHAETGWFFRLKRRVERRLTRKR